MKLEKVNDHQIRCTLTKADLADRHMKLSELAYGTDKAKSLFRDMLQQAAYQFGFEAEDIPLMIEAIPLSGECIVLIITKVEDPDELDTRFSKFAPSVESGEEPDETDAAPSASSTVSANEVLDLFKKLRDGLIKSNTESAHSEAESTPVTVSVEEDIVRLYAFDNLDDVIRLSRVIASDCFSKNSLYKCENPKEYYLVIHQKGNTPESFNKLCNICAEYGHALKYSKGQDSFLSEHGDIIIEDTAIQDLAQI